MNRLTTHHDDRVRNLIARIRSRQLDLALRGNASASARYAQRAGRVRQYGKLMAAQA